MEIRYERQGSNTYQHESGPGYYIEINFQWAVLL
jgi:hypothetical protein